MDPNDITFLCLDSPYLEQQFPVSIGFNSQDGRHPKCANFVTSEGESKDSALWIVVPTIAKSRRKVSYGDERPATGTRTITVKSHRIVRVNVLGFDGESCAEGRVEAIVPEPAFRLETRGAEEVPGQSIRHYANEGVPMILQLSAIHDASMSALELSSSTMNAETWRSYVWRMRTNRLH